MHFFLSLGVLKEWKGCSFAATHCLLCRYRWCITVCAPNRSSRQPLFWLFDLSGSVAYICPFMQPNTMSKHTSSSSSSSQKLSADIPKSQCHNEQLVRIDNFTIGLWILMMSAMQAKKRWTWYLKLVQMLFPIKWLLYYWLFQPLCNTNAKLTCQSIGNYCLSIATYQFDWVGRKFINFIHRFLACNSIPSTGESLWISLPKMTSLNDRNVWKRTGFSGRERKIG